MHIILLLLCVFVPAICYSGELTKDFDIKEVEVDKAIAPLLLAGLIIGGISLAVGIYTFMQMRKMQKKQKGAELNQMDGSITGEGTIVHDIAGSPHVYGNDVDKFNFSTSEIKQKSGGKK